MGGGGLGYGFNTIPNTLPTEALPFKHCPSKNDKLAMAACISRHLGPECFRDHMPFKNLLLAPLPNFKRGYAIMDDFRVSNYTSGTLVASV